MNITKPTSRTHRLAVTAITSLLVLSACGSDSASSTDASTSPSGADAPTDATTEAPGTTATRETFDTTATTEAEADEATVAVADTDLGAILIDGAGLTLYMFAPDSAGTPTCTGDCAGAWPPSIVEGDITAGDGIDAALLTTVEHPDGGTQLKIGTWPLYTYAGDAAPGDVTGQGVGGSWFVVGADGEPIN